MARLASRAKQSDFTNWFVSGAQIELDREQIALAILLPNEIKLNVKVTSTQIHKHTYL